MAYEQIGTVTSVSVSMNGASKGTITSSGTIDLGTVVTDVSGIEEKIPAQASSSNQLADKEFVNSSISTNTATFRGTSAAGLTEAQFLAWANTLTKTNNDYVFWNTTDEDGNIIYKRYKYNGTQWVYEYSLNNSSFTAAQWSAINSGITSGKVSTYDGYADQINNKVAKNNAITGATKTKITYDSKGLVTAGADLSASDIPGLDASKITSGTFADERIASASEWDAKYDKPAGGIPSSDMTSAVQTSLGKADSAYQKPASGIPDSDIASAATWNAKQNALTFDDVPTANSNNPVKSQGIKTYVDEFKQTVNYPDTTYHKGDVPSGVYSNAMVNKIIGASKKTKNLLNAGTLNDIKARNTGGIWNNNVYTLNGITITVNGDGTYTLSGTSTANFDFYLVVEGTSFPNGTYKVVGCPSGLNNGAYIRSGSEGVQAWNDTGNGATITISNGRLVCRIAVSNGATLNNAVFKPMITTDLTATYADYEQYFEGIRSATITKVISVGKNLTNVDNAVIGRSYDGGINPKRGYLEIPNFVAGNTYTLSQTSSIELDLFYKYADTEAFTYAGRAYSETPLVRTIPNNVEKLRILFISSTDTLTLDEVKATKVMFEQGSSATTYAPYMSAELTLPEPFIGRSAGNVADEYTPITGVINRNAPTVTYDGSADENWTLYGYGGMGIDANVKQSANTGQVPNIICAGYTTENYADMSSNARDMAISVHYTVKKIIVYNSAYTTVEAWKTYLASHPLTVVFEADTPTTEQVTPINPFIQCEPGGQISLVHAESPATESRFQVEYITKENVNYEIEKIQQLHKVSGLGYTTIVPTAANTDGIKVVVLDSEPATKYDGWLYIIKS